MSLAALPAACELKASDLDRAWYDTKSDLVAKGVEEPLRIRIHRACRALEQAEVCDAQGTDSGSDAGLIFRWVALSALYSRWDARAGQPTRDREALEAFTGKLLRIDANDRMRACLEALGEDARTLISSPFLVKNFWKAAEWDEVRPREGRVLRFEELMDREKLTLALDQVLLPVYFHRCQFVHGGSTLGSSVNRTTAKPAARALHLLVGQMTAVMIENGVGGDWGEICYPVVR